VAGLANVSFRHAIRAMRFEQLLMRWRGVRADVPVDPAAMLAVVRISPAASWSSRARQRGRALRAAGCGVRLRLAWNAFAGGRRPAAWRPAVAVFAAAGLPAPTLRIEATIGAGAAAVDVVHLATDVPTLRPELERQGLVAAGESDFREG
jgi:hypothetical protein